MERSRSRWFRERFVRSNWSSIKIDGGKEMKTTMTSMERVLTTLSHQEPDRVPLFLLATMHGAKELGMSIQEYFSKAENVAEWQIRINKKYGTDCFYKVIYFKKCRIILQLKCSGNRDICVTITPQYSLIFP
jgi:hypothetical protein